MEHKLFSPITINNLNLTNRIVVAPMCQYSAIEGSATGLAFDAPWTIINFWFCSSIH